MNKAFVREPDDDGKVYCPRCGSLGIPVGSGPLDTHILPEFRAKLSDTACFCGSKQCEVAYFNWFEVVVLVDELQGPVYPKDYDAPLCACFGVKLEDVEQDIAERTPTRIRALLEKSKSPEAACQTLAADGQCCMREAQRLYIKATQQT